ncbi:MAG: hypothetical protein GF364_12365 [Candidatus Lokiarchaeota archaeon]|nr:hypothetical protein [Candidatus Lokiarchaeota archaeon]
MHFITRLLENPKDEDPIENMLYVHRHFTRYSKGVFDGPAVKFKRTKSKIYVDGSFEYENAITLIAANLLPEDYNDKFKITGAIYGAGDFTKLLRDIGLNWEVSKSTGKTKNFRCKIQPSDEILLNKEQLKDLITIVSPKCYVLLSFKTTNDEPIKLTTKKKPPRPKSKGGSKEDREKELAKKMKFSKLRMSYSEDAFEYICKILAPDFIDEINSKTKTIELYNRYFIDNLILPSRKKVKNSILIRKLAIREGKLRRRAVIDDEEFSHDIELRI